jgi:D-sedoheptulose 7-phosphate isomerase
MKDLESVFEGASNIREFSDNYFRYLTGLLSSLDKAAIESFVNQLEEARKNQATVFFIGNGGSASTASHMANDFSFGSRSISDDLPFRTMALNDNVSIITAVANDSGYENLFLRQLKVHFRKNDKLVVISASGNSQNIIKAAEWVRSQGGKVIGLLGFDGGKLKDICEISITVRTPKGEYGPVEDVHMILDHLVYTWLWYQKRKEKIK